VYIDFLKRRAAVAVSRWQHTAKSLAAIPGSANVLLVAHKHELARTQTYPFYFYEKTLVADHGVHFAELPLDTLLAAVESGKAVGGVNRTIKRIFFQPELHMKGEDEAKALEFLKNYFPSARIALLDWFAPLHIRYATAADPYIDIYVKKQIYRDFANFSVPTIGDTNLNDYYARRHRIADEPMQFTPPPNMESKLRLGSNFGFSPQMVDLFLGPRPVAEGRDIDLHARIAVNGVAWYAAMRRESKEAVGQLKGLNIAAEGRVRRPKFFQELQRSKICFSPFGYGEVCWRDYEAFATGSILLKPDMSHLVVTPDCFLDGKTYVSLQWDLSDFSEKVRETLGNFAATDPMRQAAFDSIRNWILSKEAAAEIGALC